MKINVHDFVKKEISLKDSMTPIYEAISNSIYSNSKKIYLELIRDTQLKADNSKSDIKTIIIKDDGEGFNRKNFQTFNMAYESDKNSGKGKGRFFYLKSFEKAVITSIYEEDGKIFKRNFDFKLTVDGVEDNTEPIEIERQELCTTVSLLNIRKEAIFKNNEIEKFAWQVVLHFLLTFDTKKEFNIYIKDEDIELDLRKIFNEDIKEVISEKEFEIKNIPFRLKYMLIEKESNKDKSLIVATAEKRSVITYPLSKYNKSFKSEFEGKVVYSYIESDYLDEKVNSDRDGFREASQLEIGQSTSINLKVEEIFIESVKILEECLSEEFNKINTKKQERLEKYFDESSINLSDKIIFSNYKNQILKEINENTKDKMIERVFDEKRREIRKETQKSLEGIDFSSDNYMERVEQIKKQVDVSMHAALTDYVIERKVVIQLYNELLKGHSIKKEKRTGIKQEYDYSLENEVHNLLYPQHTTNLECGYEDHNLWLIDDSLAFQSYIASDKQMKSFIKDSENLDRPDIIFLSDYDIDDVLDSITIIELKRPEFSVNERQEKPDHQLLKYVKEIRNGKMKIDGKELQVTDTTKFYCYILVDFNSVNREYFHDEDYQMLREKKGYFKYKQNFKMYIHAYDYRAMGKDAERRNKAFFKKLGIEYY